MIIPVYLLQEFCKGRSPEAAINSIEEIGKALKASSGSDSFEICHIISGKKTKRTNLISPAKFKPLTLEKNKGSLALPDEHNFSISITNLEQYIVQDQKKHKSNEVAKPVLCVFTDNPDTHLVIYALRRLEKDCLLSKIILVYDQSEPSSMEGIFDEQIDQQSFCNSVEDIIRDYSSKEADFTESTRGSLELDSKSGKSYTFDPNSELLGCAGEKVVFEVAQGRKRCALGLYKAEWKDDQNNSQFSKSTGSNRKERIKRLENIIDKGKGIKRKNPNYNSICWPLDIIDDFNDDMLHSELKTLQKQLGPHDKLPNKKILGVIMPLIPDNFYFKKQNKNTPKQLRYMTQPENRITLADDDLASRWQKYSTLMLRWSICKNLAHAIDIFDAEGLRHTDLSDKNILIDKEEIYIIDVDSCHQGDVLDRAAVQGTERFMAPELRLGKTSVPTVYSDRFALAKLIYGVLMIDERDEEGPISSRFYRGDFVNGTLPRPRPEDWKRFDRGSKTVSEMFKKAFKDGWDEPEDRPSAKDWFRVFDSVKEKNKFILTWMDRQDR